MTARIRNQLADIDRFTATMPDRWPDPWPHRIALHTERISRFVDRALENLGALAHTPPEPDHARAIEQDAKRHGGDKPASPVEAAANRASGPQRIVTQLDTHLATAIAHLRIGDPLGPLAQHERGRLAWNELGHACTIVERWQTMDREERQALLCAGLDLPGHDEWGELECPRVASVGPSGSCDKNGLCLECAAKREAWRKRREYRDRGRADRRGVPA